MKKNIPLFNRLNPFQAVIKGRYPLTKQGSSKETYQIILDVPVSDMGFKVGDSLGIYGENEPILVDNLLQLLRKDFHFQILHPKTGRPESLGTFLSKKVNISQLNSSFFKLFPSSSLNSLKSPLEQGNEYDLVDFLSTIPLNEIKIESLVSALPPLLPKFYSIASSPLQHPNEIHLVVTVSHYLYRDKIRYGVTSSFLSHRAEIGKTLIPCYVQPTSDFTLPHDHSSIIMLGPGTGIAPFISFLQERLFRKASGQNWLFFGERNRKYDFFYEDFLMRCVQSNQLRLDLAFSRDELPEKYIQHEMHTKKEMLWEWLQQGAHLYVCGKLHPMAKQVEYTLQTICQECGGLSLQESESYLRDLRRQKRYVRDVYN